MIKVIVVLLTLMNLPVIYFIVIMKKKKKPKYENKPILKKHLEPKVQEVEREERKMSGYSTERSWGGNNRSLTKRKNTIRGCEHHPTAFLKRAA